MSDQLLIPLYLWLPKTTLFRLSENFTAGIGCGTDAFDARGRPGFESSHQQL